MPHMSEGELIGALREALIWCSGSSDFGPGGKAHEGWVKVCRPLLGGASEDIKVPSREERAMGIPLMVDQCEAKRQPRATEAMGRLQRAIEHLQKVIATLDMRLGAVLRPPEKVADKQCEAQCPPPEVPLVGAIREMSIKVEAAAQYLSDLGDRLEV